MHTLEDLDVYNLAQDFSDTVWFMVDKWDNFPKFSMGKQMTGSADSISSNIAEGYGRYFIKENIIFCFYARGSILETKNWLQKSIKRNLITKTEHGTLMSQLELIHKKLNGYIKVLKENLKKQKKD